MKYKKKNLLLWILSVLVMIGSAIYQRMTGPSYPVSGKATIGNQTFSYTLPRTHGGEGGAPVNIDPENESFTGSMIYKRLNSSDQWDTIQMSRTGTELTASIPHQPPAGKVEYFIHVSNGSNTINLTEKPVVIRFKGDVPAYILIPHIILIFIAMVFSMRTGFEALFSGNKLKGLTTYTVFLLLVGGMILGPIVQKFAFGAFWTGWPVGHDLTDNKTAVAFIMWIIAFFQTRKNKNARGWVLAASIIMLMVYLIPHSMLGSELDYNEMNNATIH